MRRPILFASVLLCCGALALAQETDSPPENYVLQIDGKDYALGLDRVKELKLADGRVLRVKLKMKAVLSHLGALVRFEHPRKLRPSSQKLSKSVTQTLLIAPTGGGVILQEYVGTDPNQVVPVVARNMVADEVGSGWKLKRREIKRKVGDLTLSGVELITTSPNGFERWTRQVLAGARDGKGILVVTQYDDDDDAERDKLLIGNFWESLQLRF